MMREADLQKEQDEKDNEIEALKRQIEQMKKKTAEMEKFKKEQKRRKKRQLEQQPDVSDSEYDEESEGEETDRKRYRRRSTDKERDIFTNNRNKTVQPRKKKPRKKSLIVRGIDESDISDQEVEEVETQKKSRKRGSFFRSEGQDGPCILNARGNKRRNSRKIRRNSQISNNNGRVPGMMFDTMINDAVNGKPKKKKKLVLKKMSDFKRKKTNQTTIDDDVEILDDETIKKKNTQYQESYLDKLKKQNQAYQNQIGEPQQKKKKKRKKKKQSMPLDDQIELIDIDKFNKKAAAMVVQRQRLEQQKNDLFQTEDLRGSIRNPIRPGQNLGMLRMGTDKEMVSYKTNKLNRKKPIKPVLNFSSVIPNKKSPVKAAPVGNSGIQLGGGSSNFWDMQMQKKQKPVRPKRRPSEDIIAIEGLGQVDLNLAVSQTIDPNSLGLKKKKKKRRKKRKPKSKDNIFASKQNFPQHHFPDLGDPTGAQTTYNPSLAGTYDNFAGLGGTQTTFNGGIFDTQGNPTMRTNMAMMDSTDRFAPPLNSGAMRAMQMHQSVNLNPAQALKTDKPRRKKKRKRKKKKDTSTIDNYSTADAMVFSNQFATTDNNPIFMSKNTIPKKPKLDKLNFTQTNSDNSWDDEDNIMI